MEVLSPKKEYMQVLSISLKIVTRVQIPPPPPEPLPIRELFFFGISMKIKRIQCAGSLRR